MTEISKVYTQCKALFSVLTTDETSRAFFGPMEAMSEAAYAHADSKYLNRMLKELLVISQTFPQVTRELLEDLGLEVLVEQERLGRALRLAEHLHVLLL